MSETAHSRRFLEYVSKYSVRSQIMRFYSLVDYADKDFFKTMAPHFLNLCLQHGLNGSFNIIFEYAGLKDMSPYQAEKSKLQTEMLRVTGELKKAIAGAKSNNDNRETAQLTFKLAKEFTRYAEYSEADEQFRKLRQYNQIPLQQIYPFHIKNNMYARRFEKNRGLGQGKIATDKISPEMRQAFIAEDLREIYEGKMNLFDNILSLQLSENQIKNEYVTEKELGLYYSLLVLAQGDRNKSRKYVKWSSRLEKLHLNFKYKALLGEVDRIIESMLFDPFIGHHRDEIRKKIRANMFFEVLKCFKVIKKEDIENRLGIGMEEARYIIKQNKIEESYLYDPTTQTLNLVEQRSSLLGTLDKIHGILKSKQNKIIQSKIRTQFEKTNAKFGPVDMMMMGGLGAFGRTDSRRNKFDHDDYYDDYDTFNRSEHRRGRHDMDDFFSRD